jgi:hypothetical protein
MREVCTKNNKPENRELPLALKLPDVAPIVGNTILTDIESKGTNDIPATHRATSSTIEDKPQIQSCGSQLRITLGKFKLEFWVPASSEAVDSKAMERVP